MGLQAMDKFSARDRFEAVGVVGGWEDKGVGRREWYGRRVGMTQVTN